MNLTKLAVISAAALAFTCSAWAQEKHSSTTSHGIMGYLDPKTGAFKPLAQSGGNPDTTFTTFTGEFVFKFTVTIKSSIPTSTPIDCEAQADVFDESGVSHDETAEVVASRSGSTATCTVTIPYSWALSTASSDGVSLSYNVDAAGGTTGEIDRESDNSLVSIKVPANGATTTETVAVTI